MEELQLDHPVPADLRVEADNTTQLQTIQDLPYGDTDNRIFSHQQQESDSRLQRFIAKLDDKIVAHCSVLLTRGTLGTAGIYHVGVLPAMRNRGIGKAVVGAACAYANSRGYRYVLLNGTGLRMYEQLGFKKLGDGYTWWLEGSRLIANPPGKNNIAFAEAIGRGDIHALEKYGRNINITTLQSPITNGMTLMQLAVHCRQPVSVEWLITQGITINTLEAWDLGWKDRAAAILAEDPCQANKQYGSSNITMLHIAAERDDTDLARLVLSAKPDLEIKDKTYKSIPLEWARHLNRYNITRLIETYMSSGSFRDRTTD